MVSIQTRPASTKGADLVQDSSAHLRGLDFVPRDARPAGEVGENSALLPHETRLHVTPPLLTHDRGCGDRRQEGRFRRTKMLDNNQTSHSVVLDSLAIPDWWTRRDVDKCTATMLTSQRPQRGPGHITFNTRGQGPRCPRHLSWEAGALDSLRAFFNLVLVAAAVGNYHFTRSRPLLL